MSTIARLLVELGMDASGFTQGVAAAQAKTQQLGSSLTGFGRGMTAAVSLPLAGLGGLALNAAGGFEQAMNQMGVVSGATAQEMAQIEQEALKLGAATSFSAGEAADAMLELAKAGLSPQETLAAASGVLDLAAAGGLDLAAAAEVAANSVNAFGLAAADTTGVANMLAAAANASSVDVSDLSEAFKMSASVFAANGQSVGDLTAALAVLGNNALKGSDAGTSLKTMLMRLSAPTDEAAGALASLGVSVYGADGSMRGFAEILADLEQGTANLSDEQRNAALSTIFGADAIRAATILLKEGSAGFAEMSAAVGKQGAAAEVAGARMSGLTGSFQYFLGSVESTLIGAVLPFTEGIAGLVRGAGDLIASFGSLPAPVQQAAVAFAAAAAAVGPVALGLGTLISFAGAALAPIALLAAAAGGLAAAFATDFLGVRTAVLQTWDALTNLWAAVSGAGPASAAAQEALALFPAALQPLAALALSAASGFQLLAGRWAAVTAAFASGGVSVSGVFGELGAVLLGFGSGAQQTTANVQGLVLALTGSQAAADAFGAGLQGVGAVTAGVAQGLGAAWAQLVDLLAPGLARVQAAFAGVGAQAGSLAPAFGGLLTAAQNLWAALAPILQAVGQAFGAALAVTAVAAVNGLGAALERIVPIAQVLVSQLGASLNFVAQTVTNAAALVKAVIDGDWSAAWSAAGRLAAGAASFITTTLSNLLSVAQQVFGGIADTVTSTLTDLGVNVEGTLASVERTWDAVWGALSGAVQPVIDIVESFRKTLADFGSWLAGVSFPNPFAGWSMPSLPSLPNPFGGGEPVGQNAGGTSFWRGGLTWVGEQGPELVDLPRGSRVFPADASRRMAQEGLGAGAAAPQVNIYATVSSELDMHELAYQVAAEIRRWRR